MAPKTRDEPDIFFPARGQNNLGIKAKGVCLSCPVRKECIEFRDATGSTSGIWGGE